MLLPKKFDHQTKIPHTPPPLAENNHTHTRMHAHTQNVKEKLENENISWLLFRIMIMIFKLFLNEADQTFND